jgi:hypothetical protein
MLSMDAMRVVPVAGAAVSVAGLEAIGLKFRSAGEGVKRRAVSGRKPPVSGRVAETAA